MTHAQVRRNVLAILDHNGLPYSQHDDGLGVRFSSALVHVALSALGTQVLITLRATVLSDVALEDRAELLDVLNALNRESHFGKWAFDDDERLVELEYELLGDDLQEAELMTVLATLARLADQQDDLLQQRFGGRRAYESK